MNRKEELEHRIEMGRKAYFRGGSTLKNILSKPEKQLSGEDILKIFNTYGIRPEFMKILLLSHGCEGDYDEFVKLLIEQESVITKLCNK